MAVVGLFWVEPMRVCRARMSTWEISEEAYALVGCTVSPGFEFVDFTLVDPAGSDAAWFRKQADVRLVDAQPGPREMTAD